MIGAEGLWPNVRKQVVGDAAPRVSGHTSYRSVIAAEQMPAELRWNAATLWAGPNCHIVHHPLSGWKAFNLVTTYHNDAPEPLAGLPVAEQEVLKGFMHVHKRARQSACNGYGGTGLTGGAIASLVLSFPSPDITLASPPRSQQCTGLRRCDGPACPPAGRRDRVLRAWSRWTCVQRVACHPR